MPLTVAVVVPTIPGREKLLSRALASVETQLRPADRVVVEHDDMRTGAARARNRALTLVDTDLVAWLDDDDELLPNHLKLLVELLEREPDVDLVYPVPRLDGGRDPTAVEVVPGGQWVKPWGVPFGRLQERHLRERGSFIPMTHVVRTELVRRAGGFPIPGTPEWPRPNVEDWGYLIRLLDAGARFRHLPFTTWVWHVHEAHTGGQPDRDH